MYYSRVPKQQLGREPWILRKVPALLELKSYSLASLRSDTLAGLTVAAVAVPQAMAYALIAGIPAEYGLYTAIVMALFGSLFASSRQLINGPTNAISIAVLSVLAPLTTPETIVPAVILLTFMVGVIQLGISALRLGDLNRYISHSVILGFTTGASALLVLDQLKNLLGVPAQGSGHENFVVRFYHTWAHSPEIHGKTALLGVLAIALILAFRVLKKRFNQKLFPELIVVVILSAIAVHHFALDAQGVKVVGTIPAKLPTFELPVFNLALVESMSGGALAVALLGMIEAISMSKAIASHTRQRLDINQQLWSEAIANFAGSFFQCIPGSGSLTRSAINHQAGAATQWSGVISAGAVALTILLFAPLAKYIPRSALAGILIVTAFKMVEWRALAFHMRVSRFDAAIVVVTGASAVFISVEFCVLIGVLISFVMAVPRVEGVLLTEFVPAEAGYVRERLPGDRPCTKISIFGLEGEMFFAAATNLEAQLARIEDLISPQTEVVLLRLKRARNPDAVGLGILDQFLAELKPRGVTVLLCGVRPDLLATLEKADFFKRMPREHLFEEQLVRLTSTQKAMEYAHSLVSARCSACINTRGDSASPD